MLEASRTFEILAIALPFIVDVTGREMVMITPSKLLVIMINCLVDYSLNCLVV